MLYLIRSFTRSNSYLKIGYTNNLQGRMSAYKIENPGFELISTRQGDMREETRMHLYLTALGWKAKFQDEWFLDIPEIYQEFHQDIGKINRVIWKNRDSVISTSDFSGRSHGIQIYEELRFQHRYENLNSRVDNEWRYWNRQRDLKGRKKLIDEGWIDYV